MKREGSSIDGKSSLHESGTHPQRRLELNMTPMVDVTFLLLIFFMVTASFVAQRALPIQNASSEASNSPQVPTDDSTVVTVEVDEFNTFYVITPAWIEEAPSAQDLHIQLRRARDDSHSGVVFNKLRVHAHGGALHERVVAALDAGTAIGFQELQLVTVEGS